MNIIRMLGLFVFGVGGYCLILNAVFKVRIYQFGMTLFVIGTAMSIIPMAF